MLWVRFLLWSLRRAYREFLVQDHGVANLRTADNVRIVSPSRLSVGEDVFIDFGSYVHCGGLDWCEGRGRVTIGKGSYIGPYCVLFGMGEVEIGEDVMVSPSVVITSVQHPYHDTSRPMYRQPRRYDKVIIDDDVYLGSNVVVTPGVRIGRGAVVGAGAVVTRDVEPYGIALGVPAVVVRSRRATSE